MDEESPNLRPIPENERPTVLALLRALYAGEERRGPGKAPEPVSERPQFGLIRGGKAA